MTAWTQLGAFVVLCVLAWWVALYPHDDGFDYPNATIGYRQGHAARTDPGVALAGQLGPFAAKEDAEDAFQDHMTLQRGVIHPK